MLQPADWLVGGEDHMPTPTTSKTGSDNFTVRQRDDDVEREMPREVVFIDPSVSHVAQLLFGLRADVEGVVLDPAKSPPAQMAEALRARRGLQAVHVIAHGRPGEVTFSSGPLSVETIASHVHDLGRIGEAIDQGGRDRKSTRLNSSH